MADEPDTANSISAQAGRPGDVPDAIRRRYFLDRRGGPGVGFYGDARTTIAAFRDRGRILSTTRSDPNAIRDMTAIARHRGWVIVTARGSAEFRREAWIEGRTAGLQVRGYRPTERDLQALERRRARQGQPGLEVVTPPLDRAPKRDTGPSTHLAVAEAVVRSRVASPTDQARMMQSARRRIAHWLEQGARFQPLRLLARPLEVDRQAREERRR